MAIKKISSKEAKKISGSTNWNEVDTLTDKQIEKAAKEDADSALPTDEELKEFKSVEKKNKEE
jgi:hypothetical protein